MQQDVQLASSIKVLLALCSASLFCCICKQKLILILQLFIDVISNFQQKIHFQFSQNPLNTSFHFDYSALLVFSQTSANSRDTTRNPPNRQTKFHREFRACRAQLCVTAGHWNTVVTKPLVRGAYQECCRQVCQN